MGAEHEAAVGLAFRKEDFAFENKVAVGLFGDDEELFVAREVDFAIHDLNLAPLIRIAPAGHGLAIEERDEILRVG